MPAVTAITDAPDRARPVRDPRARPGALQPHPVRPRRCRAGSTSCTSTSRWASSSRCTPSTTARSGASRGSPAPRSARTSSRTRPTTTPTTATSAAPSSASSPTSTPTTSSACPPRSARSGSSSRSRTTTVPRRRTRSSTTRATGAARSGPAARTPRASTSAASPATAPTCAPPVGPIHFACSDMAGAGYQHVDGAIRMGRFVAADDHREGPRMTGRIVVGYTATDGGEGCRRPSRARLAAASGSALAHRRGAARGRAGASSRRRTRATTATCTQQAERGWPRPPRACRTPSPTRSTCASPSRSPRVSRRGR